MTRDRSSWLAGRPRFRPVLLVIAAGSLVPLLAQARPPALAWLGLALLAGGAAIPRLGQPRSQGWVRDLADLSTGLLAVAGLMVAIGIGLPQRPEPALALGAAGLAATSTLRAAWVRAVVMAIGVTGIVWLLYRAGHGASHLVVSAILLGNIGYLAGALARDLDETAEVQRAAARAAARRAALLEGIRELPRETDAAAAAIVRSLVDHGFDTVVVGIVRGNLVLPVVAHGAYAPGPLSVSDGILGHAITTDRTVVVDQYGDDPRALPGAQIGSAVAAVVRVDGRPVGGLVAGRAATGRPDPDEVEAVEDMADHLGALMTTDRRVQQRRDLVARMAELDRMRHSFVRRVSEQLARPLDDIRGLVDQLRGAGLDEEERRRTLDDLRGHAQLLGLTIDALLDFSRFQAGRSEATPRPLAVSALTGPVLRGTGARIESGDAELHVVTDARLARQALDLLLAMTADGTGTVLRTHLAGDDVVLEIHSAELPPPGDGPREIVQALAEQLLAATGAGLTIERDRLLVRFPAAEEVVR